MAAGGFGKKAFVIGLGCLGAPIAIALVAAAVLFAARGAYRHDRAAATQPLSVSVPAGTAAIEPGRDLTESPAGSAPRIADVRPLRLSVRLAEGIFTIQPGPPGGDIKVDGVYDPEEYELTQQTDQGGDLGRAVTIVFARKGFFHFFFNSESTPNHVTVTIPEGIPTALDLQISKSRGDIDLGGLTLTSAHIALSTGRNEVKFTRPLEGDLERLEIRSSMGRFGLSDVGNARPRELQLHGSMGETSVDFGGAWPASFKSKARISVSMGGLKVSVPGRVRVSGSSVLVFGESRTGSLKDSQPDDPKAPELALDMSVSMGGLRVVRN
jgi:hypothetical protein